VCFYSLLQSLKARRDTLVTTESDIQNFHILPTKYFAVSCVNLRKENKNVSFCSINSFVLISEVWCVYSAVRTV